MPASRRSRVRDTATADEPRIQGPTDLRVGDTVVYSKYGGREITINGEDLLILSARDVRLVAEVAGGTASGEEVEQAGESHGAADESVRQLLKLISEVRAEAAAAKRSDLLRAMMTAGVDPVPTETIEQARRLARQRERLLCSGAYTTDALRDLRGDASTSSTRTWLARRRAAGELFTVMHENSTLVPAFQLDEDARPRPAAAAVLAAIAPAGLSGWATWTWFVSGTPWLGGSAPCQLLDTDPERVIRAASRFASNAA